MVCAYEPSSDISFGIKNTLAFEHIFARISTVTVTAVAPTAISDITINLVDPKTGGVYNLRTGAGQTDGTGWSSLLPASGSQQLYRNAGSITAGASNTGSDNDFYIVPGVYQLEASWTASVGDYSQEYSTMSSTSTVSVQGGKVNSISCSLSGDVESLSFGVSVTVWDTQNKVAEFEIEPTFGGLMIAPLYYSSMNGFEIKDDDWNHDSYNTVYGKNDGSYFFNFVEVGQFFDADGESFSAMSGDIDNTIKISYGGYDDWRVPTLDELCTFTTGDSPGTSRTGSMVNGNAGSKFAIIQLTGVTHAGSSTPAGLLLFPDGNTITGKVLSSINNGTSCTTGVTGSELQAYLNQGCVFLPASGMETSHLWWGNGVACEYLSSTSLGENTAMRRMDCGFYIDGNDQEAWLSFDIAQSKSGCYFSVRLVRDAE